MMRMNANRVCELRKQRGLPSPVDNAEYYGRLKEQETLNDIFQVLCGLDTRTPHTATEAMHYFPNLYGRSKLVDEIEAARTHW